MTSLEISPADALAAMEAELARDNQRPVHSSIPPCISSAGREIANFSAGFGLILDPWEAWVLDKAMGWQDDGRWAAMEVALIAPRQNGKDAILEARALAGLYLFHERLILYTCHQFKTAGEAFIRVRDWVTNTDALRRKVKRVIGSHGEEGIELMNGQRLRFIARSRTSGRGFTGDLVILNEAFELPEAAIAATVPTLSTRPNAQLWYTSTAPDADKDMHAVTLTRVRNRGRAKSAGERLAYFEWGLDYEGLSDDMRKALRRDERAWRRANPGYEIRLQPDFIRQVELPQFSPATFDVERLGVGNWPLDEEQGWLVISEDDWNALADNSNAPLPDVVAFSVEVTWDREFSVIAAYGRRPDQLGQMEVVQMAPRTEWVPERLVELNEKHRPCAIVIDGGGPARSLIPSLSELGIEVLAPTLRDVAGACGSLVDACRPEVRGFRHLNQPELNLAVAYAKRRDLGDLWLFERRAAPGAALMAGTLAKLGHDLKAPTAGGDPGVWLI